MDDKVQNSIVSQMMEDIIHLIESLSALKSISSLHSRAKTLGEILRDALRILIDHEDMQSCSIFLVQGETLVNVAALGLEDIAADKAFGRVDQPVTAQFRVGEGLMGLAAASGELQHARDCQIDKRFKPQLDVPGDVSPGCIISVPIRGEGITIGVLNVSHPEPSHFTQWHERLLCIFCDILGQSYYSRNLLLNFENEVVLRTRQLERALAEADALKNRYERLCITDELTGLNNRRFFFPEFESELSRAIRHGNEISLLILDIDNFKQVNDTYGHLLGDKVLREVGALLRKHIRGGDILARFGGEEFVIALPFTDSRGAIIFAERLRDAVSLISVEQIGGKGPVTVSIGTTCFKGETELSPLQLLDKLVGQADQALYHCKRHGRNKVCDYAEIQHDA
jgi:diguanylate cyclase (GGDEF)-like protein